MKSKDAKFLGLMLSTTFQTNINKNPINKSVRIIQFCKNILKLKYDSLFSSEKSLHYQPFSDKNTTYFSIKEFNKLAAELDTTT